ncbi:MAG: hypothetical protein WKF83_03265 [Nocardioidaceae bacterium]
MLNTWPSVDVADGDGDRARRCRRPACRVPGRRWDCIEIARTMPSPMCWATSRVSVDVLTVELDVDL